MKTEWPGWKFVTLVLCGLVSFFALLNHHLRWKLSRAEDEQRETIAGVKVLFSKIEILQSNLTKPVQQTLPDDRGTPRHIGERTIQPKPGWIWVSFEEDGHKWMVGARKEQASADDDPGFMKTDFASGYCLKIQEVMNTQLFHNCCMTNIQILTNYAGTVQYGTNLFRFTTQEQPLVRINP